MRITKAEMDAALDAAMKKIDSRIDAGMDEIKNEFGLRSEAEEEKLMALHDDIFEAMEERMAEAEEKCGRDREELRRLREEFIGLEKAFDRFRSQHAAEDISDENPDGNY